MEQIKHHINDQLLMGYAAGALPEAFDVVIATHVSMCDDCRARLGGFEAVGGAMIDNAEVVEVSETSLEKTLSMIAASPKGPIQIAPLPNDTVFPQPLHDYVGGDLGSVKWRALGGGVRQAILPTTADATVRLLSIPGGMKMPDHGHNGTELTMVLQGAFVDESARFARGDIEIADEEVEHTPIAEPGLDCICLAATDAPLRFNSWLPRLAQRFGRI